VQDPKDHMAGVRIFDVSNAKAPKLVKNVQTCKGSHTHTLVPSKKDPNIIYLYVSGAAGAPRDGAGRVQERHGPGRPHELAVSARHHQGRARSPERAVVIPGARIFSGLDVMRVQALLRLPIRPAPRGPGGRRVRRYRGRCRCTGPRNCHDVTAYPEMNLLAASCSTHSILVDISNPKSRSASTP
jgi:hypothetical protein